MTTVVGGLRTRLTFDSIYNHLNDSLTTLGWFDAGREHLPINFMSEPVAEDEEVPLNTLTLTAEDIFDFDAELGSNYSEHRRSYFLDFYAEGHALGEHLVYDVRDILEGRFTTQIGSGSRMIPVYDYRVTPTPPELFKVDVEFVAVDRAINSSKPWQKHWWSVAWTIVDYYGDEND